jgi:hypothetical protein
MRGSHEAPVIAFGLFFINPNNSLKRRFYEKETIVLINDLRGFNIAVRRM